MCPAVSFCPIFSLRCRSMSDSFIFCISENLLFHHHFEDTSFDIGKLYVDSFFVYSFQYFTILLVLFPVKICYNPYLCSSMYMLYLFFCDLENFLFIIDFELFSCSSLYISFVLRVCCTWICKYIVLSKFGRFWPLFIPNMFLTFLSFLYLEILICAY